MPVEIVRGINPQTGEDVGGKVGFGSTTRIDCTQDFTSCPLRADLNSPDYGPTCWAKNLDAQGKVVYGQVNCGKHPRVEPLIK